MVATIVRIKVPIWNGRKVGIASYLLQGGFVDVFIDYKKKDGSLSYPYLYRIESSRVQTYPTQMVDGVRLHLLPIAELEIVRERT